MSRVPFLLRFEDRPRRPGPDDGEAGGEPPRPALGTTTYTEVRKEDADKDPVRRRYRAIPPAGERAAPTGHVFLLRFEERGDCGPTVAPCLATQTHTRQNAESPDQDPRAVGRAALPRRSAFPATPAAADTTIPLNGTQTKTSVQPENADPDPRSRGRRALPRCS